MRRPVAALLALAATAMAGCGSSYAGHCPGVPLASFVLALTLDSTTCPTDQVSTQPFAVTITSDTASGAAWACSGRRLSEPLVGTLSGDHLQQATATTGGGVFGACGASCAVAVTENLDGTLSRAPGGAITGFTGTLTEDASALEGSSCGTPSCVPCEVRYTVVSAP